MRVVVPATEQVPPMFTFPVKVDVLELLIPPLKVERPVNVEAPVILVLVLARLVVAPFTVNGVPVKVFAPPMD